MIEPCVGPIYVLITENWPTMRVLFTVMPMECTMVHR